MWLAVRVMEWLCIRLAVELVEFTNVCVRLAGRLLDVLDNGFARDLNDSVTRCLESDWQLYLCLTEWLDVRLDLCLAGCEGSRLTCRKSG